MIYRNPKITNLIEYIWQISGANDKTNPIEIIEQIGCLLLIKNVEHNISKDEQEQAPYTWDYIVKNKIEQELAHNFAYVYNGLIAYYEQKFGSFGSDVFDNNLEAPNSLSDLIQTLNSLFDILAKEEGLTSSVESFIFEMLLNKTVLIGAKGQFRTPRHIVNLMTELANPQSKDTIIDPACGTGGFLLSRMAAHRCGKS